MYRHDVAKQASSRYFLRFTSHVKAQLLVISTRCFGPRQVLIVKKDGVGLQARREKQEAEAARKDAQAATAAAEAREVSLRTDSEAAAAARTATERGRDQIQVRLCMFVAPCLPQL